MVKHLRRLKQERSCCLAAVFLALVLSGLASVNAQGGTAQPFEVSISNEVLNDLQSRLTETRRPDQVEGAGWGYGTNLDYLQELVTYWQNDFDWRTQEARLNRFSNFMADVDGTNIHFIRTLGKSEEAIPVLVLHGWPSSFVQMLDLIPLLTTPDENRLSFDVVVPSLVGYGFSEISDQSGMSVAKMAELFHKLMTETLGYERYAVRGSDLGAGVIQQMALRYPDEIIGVHLSGTNPFIAEVPKDLTPAEGEFVANAQAWNQQEMAYAMEHSSYPQTLAYALNDSPVGLASWVVEKFRAWSDNNGNLESAFSKDELLTNLTIYWVTQTINSSMRLYYETARDPGEFGRVAVPTGMLMSNKDMFPTPRAWAERSYNVVRWTPIDEGGHFLEWEQPERVAQDMPAFFASLNP